RDPWNRKPNYRIVTHGVPRCLLKKISTIEFQQGTPPFFKTGSYTRFSYSSNNNRESLTAAFTTGEP
ncbi:MAG: hypothetical protein KGJ55_12270, partial [Gammaproteobacteria bacterium]|nr:hypothetical protein [Gammaproteobacteria bacterium]